ncbi:MAG: Flp pilus assembly protein CpaB [Fuerstiella sp.]
MIPLVVAGGCGLVAMLGVKQYLANKDGENEVPMATALVAAAEIEFGSPLTELNTRLISVPAATCPEDAIVDMEQVKDKALKISRSPGDMIRLSQLAEGQGKTVRIPDGMKVATIPVDATTNHSGILQPGNRIDLLLTYSVKQRGGRDTIEKVAPILQYIEVFAVENQVFGAEGSAGENTKARNISLLVTDEQAMKLTLARKKGDLSTMLRSNSDKGEIDLAVLSEESLFGGREDTINETSSNQFDGLGDAFQMPELISDDDDLENEAPINMFAQLQAVSGEAGMATGPMEALASTPETWTMTIFERGVGRRVEVNVDSEEPLDLKLPEDMSSNSLTSDAMSAAYAPSNDGHQSGPSLEELTSGVSQEDAEELESKLEPLLDLFQ